MRVTYSNENDGDGDEGLVGNLLTVLVGSCVFLINSSVVVEFDPRTISLTVLVGSF